MNMMKASRFIALILVLALMCGTVQTANADVVTLGIYFCGRRTAEDGTQQIVKLEELTEAVKAALEAEQKDLLAKAKAHLEAHIYEAKTYDEFKDTVANKPGFVKAEWCGDVACELKIKEDTTATSRCMPFAQEHISDKCVCCGRPAKKLVIWGKAY